MRNQAVLRWDWHNNTGVIRQAKEQEMGVILVHPLTSEVFQRLMAEAFSEINVLDVGCFDKLAAISYATCIDLARAKLALGFMPNNTWRTETVKVVSPAIAGSRP
jgi:hypothetical protein